MVWGGSAAVPQLQIGHNPLGLPAVSSALVTADGWEMGLLFTVIQADILVTYHHLAAQNA